MVAPARDLRQMEVDLARDCIQAFELRFNQPTLYFAWHAAFPMAITPDLLYHLWVNFRLDTQNRPLYIPWVATADLLLSDLVKPVGHEIYEMDGTVRELFLQDIKNASDENVFPCFGPIRLRELGDFLLEYITPQLNAQNPFNQHRARAQKLVAQAYRDPPAAVQSLARQLIESIQKGDFSEQLRLNSVARTLASALQGQADFDGLQEYIDKRAVLVDSDRSTLPSHSQPAAARTTVCGVVLPALTENLPSLDPALQVEALLQQASQAIQQQKWEIARDALEKARQIQPDSPRLADLSEQLKSTRTTARRSVKKAEKKPVKKAVIKETETDRTGKPSTGAPVESQKGISLEIRFLPGTPGEIEIFIQNPSGQYQIKSTTLDTNTVYDVMRELDLLSQQVETEQTFNSFLRMWGEKLYRAIFHDEAQVMLESARALAEENDLWLNLLFVTSEAPELSQLPWEYLYDPVRAEFLGLSGRTLIARCPKVKEQKEVAYPTDYPLRVLLAVSNPQDLSPINISAEETAFSSLMANLEQTSRDRFIFEMLTQVDVQSLRSKIWEILPHILYLIVPGNFERESRRAYLGFPDKDGKTEWIPARDLAKIFLEYKPRLIFLIPPEGKGAPSRQAFDEMAQVLVQYGIPAVISISTLINVSQPGRDLFLTAFMQELFGGMPLNAAFAGARRSVSHKLNEMGSFVLYGNQQVFQMPFITEERPETVEKPPAKSRGTAKPAALQARLGWTLGLDVNYWNGEIDWQQVAKDKIKARYAYIRASRGKEERDPAFTANWEGAHKAGLLCGPVHVFRFSDDPIQQAKLALDVIGSQLTPEDLPLAVDIEEEIDQAETPAKFDDSGQRRKSLSEFLRLIASNTGRKPVIYTNPAAWRRLFDDSPEFADYPLWIANYDVDSPVVPANSWGSRGWSLWQFTNKGRIIGIGDGKAGVNLNWFQGSIEDFRRFFSLPETPPKTGKAASPPADPLLAQTSTLVSLRTRPSAESTLLATLAEETQLTIMNKASEGARKIQHKVGWLHVRTSDGLEGYVESRYLRVFTEPPKPTGGSFELSE